MRKLILISLFLWSFLPIQQIVRADGVTHLAFSETYNLNTGTGGRDDSFSGNIASRDIFYDLEGWTGNKYNFVYGGNSCLRFGNSSNTGFCTTPEIILIGTGKTATLTFNAAGWGDSGANTLTVTANEGVTLDGDTQVTLKNGEWIAYTVNITVTTAKSVQLTFTGKRGFLDDVKVVETVTAINAPTLTDEFSFWPNTSEVNATTHVTVVPSDSTIVYYTTDDSTPSESNGKIATLTSNISVTGTTTVKAIAYYKTIASNVVSKTYTQGYTVNGISEFRDLSNDTEARIFFSDDENHEARVLYYDESNNQLFLRDKTGALCIDFGTTAAFSPTPQYNQHVAGWLVGKRADDDGLPKLVATANTTTDYLAIANPVTESQTEPTSIGNGDLNNHLADWVTITEQRVGSDLAVINRFSTGAYDGALTDLSGIVIPNGSNMQIAPISQNGIPAVVYVIDEQQAFVSPDANITGATVRLKRTLSKDYWNTFAVPFNITSLNGIIREYDHADGNTMVFADADVIEAGKPYLVKPAADIENPVFSNVTLSSTPAITVYDGDYSFVAIYSPTQLATSQTELFLKSDGLLYYPTANSKPLRGMRAFFRAPAGQTARLLLDDGNNTGLSTMHPEQLIMQNDAVYDLQGRKVNSQLKKGLYIVNGKKIVIR